MALTYKSFLVTLICLHSILPILCMRTDLQPVQCTPPPHGGHGFVNGIDDCNIALEMIPSGFLFTGDPGQWPYDQHGPRSKHLPAMFRYASCMITVTPAKRYFKLGQVSGLNVSSLYFQVWPEARLAAERVIQKCLVGNKTDSGHSWGFVTLTGREFLVDVGVKYYCWRTQENLSRIARIHEHHGYELSSNEGMKVSYFPPY
jgi:hypothetical protein